ncbi:MAG TPA: HdeA/HdeB family chaperone [Xanthobacteraceae bacterium]|nr:HdeA/HdeB family chaperone [Xanthobacteraceae bacterium]
MRVLSAAVIAAVVAATSPSSAQVVDVSAVSCKDFSGHKKDAMLAIMMWLSGYYTKDDDPTVIDFDKVRAKADKLADFCAKNPAVGLIPAAEPILASE